MRLLFKTLRWLLTLALLAVGAFGLWVFLDSRPLVPQERSLTVDERAWAEDWLRAARPRRMKDGERLTLTLSEADANVLGTYLIDKLGQGRIAVRLEDGRARLIASLGLPWNPRGSFVNLDLTVAEAEPLPRIEHAKLAGVPIPNGLVQRLANRFIGAMDQSQLLLEVALKPDFARFTYEWHPNMLENLGSSLVSDAERARILRYQDILSRYGAARPKGRPIPLAALLSHLLLAARDQGPHGSPAPTTDPVTENRSAILALAAYVNRSTVRDPAGLGTGIRPIAFRTVKLRGRRDLAQHFMTSAALAAQGSDTLSDLLGLFKEVNDSQGGSGFSFADLAADRAGTRFAQLAVGDRKGARAVQGLAQQGLAEDDIMPPIDGLPEGIRQAEFAADYRDMRSPAYRAVTERIERRIDRLRLHRQEGG